MSDIEKNMKELLEDTSNNNTKYDELKKIIQKIINDLYKNQDGSMISKMDDIENKVNKMLDDVDNMVKSSTEPTNKKEGMLWIDTTDKVIKIRTQNKWTILGAGW